MLLQDKLFDLEARMIQTTSETAKQTTKVNKLQEKVRGTHACGSAHLLFIDLQGFLPGNACATAAA